MKRQIFIFRSLQLYLDSLVSVCSSYLSSPSWNNTSFLLTYLICHSICFWWSCLYIYIFTLMTIQNCTRDQMWIRVLSVLLFGLLRWDGMTTDLLLSVAMTPSTFYLLHWRILSLVREKHNLEVEKDKTQMQQRMSVQHP